MYFATDENHLIISYGPDEYPNSEYVDDSILPESWEELFSNRMLAYANGEFFVPEVTPE